MYYSDVTVRHNQYSLQAMIYSLTDQPDPTQRNPVSTDQTQSNSTYG